MSVGRSTGTLQLCVGLCASLAACGGDSKQERESEDDAVRLAGHTSHAGECTEYYVDARKHQSPPHSIVDSLVREVPCAEHTELLGVCATSDWTSKSYRYLDSEREGTEFSLFLQAEEACKQFDGSEFEPAPGMASKRGAVLDDLLALVAHDTHSCAASESRGVYCWGSNDDWQLGNGTKDSAPHYAPEPVSIPAKVVALHAYRGERDVGADPMLGYGAATCALTDAGQVYCWGADSPLPARVEGLPELVAFSKSREPCGLTRDNGVWCWGVSGGAHEVIQLDRPVLAATSWFVLFEDHTLARIGEYGLENDPLGIGEPIYAFSAYGSVPDNAADFFRWGTWGICLSLESGVKCGPYYEYFQYWGDAASVVAMDGHCTVSADNTASCDLATALQPRVISDVVAVSMGVHHRCAITTGGEAACWRNSTGKPRSALGYYETWEGGPKAVIAPRDFTETNPY